ncbi:hypothetical protein PN498_28305 [Oscillatoria sp. CS-180]|uniref:hypothetical protein n=1 Tax=Oscillatoria sp. CS-180 TaxID=3021720 RepID=UPI00232E822C|nr:hypothetical protein [Oscillatoria sp. CS-180]MDB9529922.1 hypothetical protein [Oscillatoria sp. CS-180]
MAACTSTPEIDGPNYYPTDLQGQGIVRGGMGYLSSSEVAFLKGLAWPQSYADMTSTFGRANRSTDTADIYRVEGSDQKVWVYYDGTTATGFEIKE